MARKGGASPPIIVYIFAVLIILNLVSKLLADPDFAEGFPLFAAIGAFLLFRYLTSRNGKRQSPAPAPEPELPAEREPQNIGFEIPPLRGAPQEEQPEVQTVEEDLDVSRQQSLRRHLAEKKTREEKQEQERLRREHQAGAMRAPQTPPQEAGAFSPAALRNALIWSEIIAPPKAMRRVKR